MNFHKNERLILLLLSILTGTLICLASYSGLTDAGFYHRETLNWRAQSIGQDLINLFLAVPFLLVSAFFVAQKKDGAFSLWAGTTLYLIYTYLIYCFNIHFNNYFIVYCLILGLCFYMLIFFMHGYVRSTILMVYEKRMDKVIAVYFLIISVSFYFLWLMDIIPAILHHTIPEGIKKGGLFTNPVQVIDLSVFLPGVFITGIWILKKKKWGRLLAPILLVFFILMDLTIALLTIVMIKEGVASDYSIAFIMSLLALFSFILLLQDSRKISIVP